MKLHGRHRKVLMQAPKNGFFYVIDRVTGELLSAKPYIGVTWASHIDMKTGRPVENPGARYYQNEDLKAEVIPSLLGAHNWHPMSYSQYTRLVYIPAHEFKSTYRLKPDSLFGGMLFDYYGDDMAEEGLHLKPGLEGKIGRLIAWDPLKGEARWQVDHVLPMNGGVMSTAGNLVFQGTAVGGFHVFSSDTGRQLWYYNVHTSVQAPPITYDLDKYGITVNYVLPGLIGTPMALDNYDPELIEAWKSGTATGRIGTPDDIARVVLFLASEDSRYMTGAGVCVDAGHSLHE